MEYQPKNKSFEYYIKTGYEYASGSVFSNKELDLLKSISDIDTSIIKIDGILDKEEYRNNKRCIYLVDGIENTIISAKLDEISGIEALTKLIELRKCFPEFSYEILKVFNNNYMRGIYEGQKIDRDLEIEKVITNKTLDRYFEMVALFTGGHIRYGLELGQLLAGKIPDKKVSKIGELLGINRQIVDDFQDYFKAHHFPFGDIRRSAKRLPEILFTLGGGDRELVMNLINEKKFEEIIDIVLSEKVRIQLFNYCEENIQKCRDLNSNFDFSSISVDHNELLDRN